MAMSSFPSFGFSFLTLGLMVLSYVSFNLGNFKYFC